MKLPPFRLHRPGSVEQASRLLADLGDDAAAFCGGTELLLAMKLGLTTYEHLVDLKRVDGLRGITVGAGGVVRIGAATTHHELETSAALRARYPEMSMMISQVANIRVRSVGTLGGSLCFADPHSDPASFLIAVGATLECQHGDQIRRIPVAAFPAGLYETILAPGELLTAVELPARQDRTGLSHRRMKLTERPVVTVSAQITVSGNAVAEARLLVGSVGIMPFAADATALLGATAADFAARSAACAGEAAAECAPLPDGEASAAYLRHLVTLYAREALEEAFAAAARTRLSAPAPAWVRGVMLEPASEDNPAVEQVVRLRAIGRLESRGQQRRDAGQVGRLSSGAHRGDAQMIVPELGDGGEEFRPQALATEPGRKPAARLPAHGSQGRPAGNQAAGRVHGQQPVIEVPRLSSPMPRFQREQAIAPRLGDHHPGWPAEPPLRLRVAGRRAHDRPIGAGGCLQPQPRGEYDVMAPAACLGRRPGPCSQHLPSSQARTSQVSPSLS